MDLEGKDLPDLDQRLPPGAAALVEKHLGDAIEKARNAKLTQEEAERMMAEAAGATDPVEKDRLMSEAKKLDKQARGHLKMAQRLGSGAWQGFGAGAGIGAATGLGLGTIVGTVVGGVAAIPTTALGGAIGAGTGAIHGPWVKFPLDPNELGKINAAGTDMGGDKKVSLCFQDWKVFSVRKTPSATMRTFSKIHQQLWLTAAG